MIGLAKMAALALAAAGTSNVAATPDRTTENAAIATQIGGGTGLSFEDLRVGPNGKVAVGVGPTTVPVRVADNSGGPSCTN